MSFERIKSLASVSNALLSGILEGVPTSTEHKTELLALAGLSWDDVRDPMRRTSILALSRLWKEVLIFTRDPFFGLRVGAAVRSDRFGLTAHAAQNSADFRQALRRFTKYASLINDLILCELTEEADVARLRMRFRWDLLGLERHAVDIAFANIVAWASSHLDQELVIREARFRHSLKSSHREYERVFRAPVVFGAATNELIFASEILDARVREANPDLGLILESFAGTELAKVPVLTDLPARVSQILGQELENGRTAGLAKIAGELRIAPRQIQRMLHDASTSYRDLLEQSRKTLAPRLLSHPEANVEQVGFRLGYSEPTAFIRAFRKWYGTTPGDFRRFK